jgi:hypothetical protein
LPKGSALRALFLPTTLLVKLYSGKAFKMHSWHKVAVALCTQRFCSWPFFVLKADLQPGKNLVKFQYLTACVLTPLKVMLF